MKNLSCLPIAVGLLYTVSCHAQTHLVTRGTVQLLKGDTLFTMQDKVDYRVIGVSAKSPKGVFIETPIGAVDFPQAERFRVLPGGSFAEDVTGALKDVEAQLVDQPGISEDDLRRLNQREGLPVTAAAPFYGAEYSATLIIPASVGHVYAAFQWSVDNEPVATETLNIGKVTANTPVNVSLRIPLDPSQSSGTYSIHIYSGYLEVKCEEIRKKQQSETSGKAKPKDW